MKNTKCDNTNAPAKIALRKHFLDLMHPRKILECYAEKRGRCTTPATKGTM